MSAQPKLDKVLTIPEVAAIAGWDARRMRRHLLKVNREVGGMLLRNAGGSGMGARWTVTLAALQRIAPQWFTDPETVQSRLNELECEVARLRKLVDVHSDTLEALVA